MPSFTVATNGQTLVVTAVTLPAGGTPTVYTSAAYTTSVSWPQTLITDTTYYLREPEALVTVAQPDGSVLASASRVTDGMTLSPKPTPEQIAADTSVKPLSGARDYSHATTAQVFDAMPAPTAVPWFVAPPASLFAASSAGVWYTANAATIMQFHLPRTRTFRYVNLHVGTQSGNIQVGVVRLRPGAASSTTVDYERVAHSGVIACPGTGSNRIDLGLFTLTPGDYGLFLWCDNTTAQFCHGATAGMAASRLTFSATGLASGVPSGVNNVGATTRWVSGLSLEAGKLTTTLLGDSITANDNADPTGGGSWFSKMDQATGYRFHAFTNAGTAGENSTQILARAAASFSGQRYATVLAGTNDIGQNVSASTITANLAAIYAAAVSAGLTGFAACTIPPRCGTGGAGTPLTASQASTLQTVNAWIRANYSSYAGGTLVDWSWALSNGANEYTPLSANFSDDVHPNATGSTVMASVLGRAIRDWV